MSPSNRAGSSGCAGLCCLWACIWLPGVYSKAWPGLSGAQRAGAALRHTPAEDNSEEPLPQASFPTALPREEDPAPASFALVTPHSLCPQCLDCRLPGRPPKQPWPPALWLLNPCVSHLWDFSSHSCPRPTQTLSPPPNPHIPLLTHSLLFSLLSCLPDPLPFTVPYFLHWP